MTNKDFLKEGVFFFGLLWWFTIKAQRKGYFIKKSLMTNISSKIQPMVTTLFQIQLITKPVTPFIAASKNQFSCYLIQ